METQYHLLSAFLKSKRFFVMFGVICSMLVALAFMGMTAAPGTVYAVSIYDGELSEVVETTETDPEAIVKQAGYRLGENDIVEADDFQNGTGTLTVRRAFTVSVRADGAVKTVKLAKGSYADVLELAGVTVSDYDRINVSVAEEAVAGAEIVINRVAERTYTVTEEIPFETEEVKTDDLDAGVASVETAGVPGEKTYTYLEVAAEGKAPETVLLCEEVTVAPVTQKILVGTHRNYTDAAAVESAGAQRISGGNTISELAAPAGLMVDQNGVPANYTQIITGRATAYTASAGALTSTGKTPMPGYIAVDPKKIPYGTEMWITSADGSIVYGYAIAADTGGDMRNGRFLCDLYMNTAGECFQWGVRNINIYVLS